MVTAANGHASNSVTVAGTSATSIDMVAENAGDDFLIKIDGYEQFGAMAQYSVIDDGTYVPPQKSSADSEDKNELSAGAVAGISVVMCLVGVALFALIYVVQKKKSTGYSHALDDSATIVFNPALDRSSEHYSDKGVTCSWCQGNHLAEECKMMKQHLSNKGKTDSPTSPGSPEVRITRSPQSLVWDSDLKPLDNI